MGSSEATLEGEQAVDRGGCNPSSRLFDAVGLHERHGPGRPQRWLVLGESPSLASAPAPVPSTTGKGGTPQPCAGLSIISSTKCGTRNQDGRAVAHLGIGRSDLKACALHSG